MPRDVTASLRTGAVKLPIDAPLVKIGCHLITKLMHHTLDRMKEDT